MSRSVSLLVYDGMSGFGAGVVAEIFGTPAPEAGDDWYELAICSERPGQVPVPGGSALRTSHGLDDLAAARTVIIPGVADVTGTPSPELVEALRLAHARGARVVSVCIGAFALAGAGLLDGRRATTHWHHADLLQRRYPRIDVDPGVLYIDDGDVLTSAGHAAALDLSLHLVRTDFGAAVANALARRLVVQPHRDGGQAQFIEAPVARDPDDDRIARSMEWALEHLAEPLTVRGLAAQVTMSPRTFVRHFARSTGTTPIRWLVRQRVQSSLPLLETTATPVEEIATAVGFETAVTYRHHFRRIMRTSPSAYRAAFHTGGAATGARSRAS